jgi:hypothetical protein
MATSDARFEPLFQAAPDWQHNACVGPSITSIATYADGYLRAARLLVNEVVLGCGTVDVLVYPIVFNYRQYLELRLKEIVLSGRRFADTETKHDRTHRLTRSWQQAKSVLACDLALPGVAGLDFVDRVLAEFDALDSGSFTFRYATDKNQTNRSIPADIQHINVRHFAAMIERLADVLEGISMTLSVMRDGASEEYQRTADLPLASDDEHRHSLGEWPDFT